MENDRSIDERRFEAAVKVMRKLPEDGTFEPSDEMLVQFYSYYKQATVGPCNTTKPNGWDSIGKEKWEAWKALGEMTKEQAMKEYVQEIQLILEMIPVTDEVSELMDELDPFYEVVDEKEDDDVASKPATLAIEAGLSDEDEEVEIDGGWGSFVEDEEDGVELEDSSEGMIGSGEEKDVREASVLCNGSAEVSSLTNGTHSSLNTEEEEEELACSTENSLDNSQDIYPCTDYISDEVSEWKQQSDDTDCEVCSKNPPSQESLGVSRGQLAGSEAFGARRLEDPRGSQDAKRQETLLSIPVAAGPVQSEQESVDRGRDEHYLAGSQICDAVETTLRVQQILQCVVTAPVDNKHRVKTQIASALLRLQDDMQNVLQRLNTLEALTADQEKSIPLGRDPLSASVNKRFPWWPLDTSSIPVALALIWPFAVNWIVQLYLQRKRRRIK